MDFYAILDQVVDLLRSRQRATYRTLRSSFKIHHASRFSKSRIILI
jgi:hypothetical protein